MKHDRCAKGTRKWEDPGEKTISFGGDRFSELRVLSSMGGKFAKNAD